MFDVNGAGEVAKGLGGVAEGAGCGAGEVENMLGPFSSSAALFEVNGDGNAPNGLEGAVEGVVVDTAKGLAVLAVPAENTEEKFLGGSDGRCEFNPQDGGIEPSP